VGDGDPEEVVDEHGWLPRDRREQTWWSYRLDRERKVRDLKQQRPELEAALQGAIDRAERRERRDKLAEATRDLDRLIAEGPFTSEEMCSECATPMAHLGHPCPAWPGWAARMRDAQRILKAFASAAKPRQCRRPTPSRSPSPSFPPGSPSPTS